MTKLPEELVELIFDKLLEQYPPEVETKKSLFSLGDRQALSALTTVSLMAARRTRTHRFKCVVLFCEPRIARSLALLASFLELSFSSRHMGRLLPISTITTHVKVIIPRTADWSHNMSITNLATHERMMSFILRLRNEFRLEQLSWHFDPMFAPSRAFHQRFAGLLLSPTMKTISIHNFTSQPNELQGAYVPGPTFNHVVHFGEEDDFDQLGRPREVYPSYTKLELGGSKTLGLPLPLDITLPNGIVHRPFAHLQTLVIVDGLPYALVQSVLKNNDGNLEVLHIRESFNFSRWRKSNCLFFTA